jgi:hypothetical protein
VHRGSCSCGRNGLHFERNNIPGTEHWDRSKSTRLPPVTCAIELRVLSYMWTLSFSLVTYVQVHLCGPPGTRIGVSGIRLLVTGILAVMKDAS